MLFNKIKSTLNRLLLKIFSFSTCNYVGLRWISRLIWLSTNSIKHARVHIKSAVFFITINNISKMDALKAATNDIAKMSVFSEFSVSVDLKAIV